MKKSTRILIIFLLPLIIIFLSAQIYRKIAKEKTIKEKIEQLPSFSFLQQNGIELSKANLKNETGIVIIIYFNPSCEHCQYMTKEITKNISSFNNIEILMVTVEDSIAVNHFISEYGIDKSNNIIVLRDTKYRFNKIFGATIVPTFLIYKKNNLIKKITGETKIENIIDAIK